MDDVHKGAGDMYREMADRGQHVRKERIQQIMHEFDTNRQAAEHIFDLAKEVEELKMESGG